jgi:thymidylate synthase
MGIFTDYEYSDVAKSAIEMDANCKIRGHSCVNYPNVTMWYDLRNAFPIISTKQVYWKTAINEILGYLRGYTWAYDFDRHLGVKTWYANANSKSWQNSPHCAGPDDMGEVYGAIWRNWDGRDPLFDIVKRLSDGEYDRRCHLSGWDERRIKKACLYPCMHSHTFTVSGDVLHMTSFQRSGDWAVGIPFNTVQCGFLLQLVAALSDLKAGTVLHVISDAHVYTSHAETLHKQCSQEPIVQYPRLIFDEKTNNAIDHWKNSDKSTQVLDEVLARIDGRNMELRNYEHLGKFEYDFKA